MSSNALAQVVEARYWSESDHQPLDASFIPAMQRRRLSPVIRSVFAMMNGLSGAVEQIPVVYWSPYGESERTLSVMQEVVQRDGVSPMGFCLSVHNAVIGQWSIFKNDASPMSAVSGELDAAFLEAAGFLHFGYSKVLVVLHNSAIAKLYRDNLHTLDEHQLGEFSECFCCVLGQPSQKGKWTVRYDGERSAAELDTGLGKLRTLCEAKPLSKELCVGRIHFA